MRFLVHQGHVERATDEFLRLQSSWPARGDVSQVALARQYLASRTARELPTPLRMRLSGQGQKARGAWRKRTRPK